MLNKTEFILSSMRVEDYRRFRKALHAMLGLGVRRHVAVEILAEGIDNRRIERDALRNRVGIED